MRRYLHNPLTFANVTIQLKCWCASHKCNVIPTKVYAGLQSRSKVCKSEGGEAGAIICPLIEIGIMYLPKYGEGVGGVGLLRPWYACYCFNHNSQHKRFHAKMAPNPFEKSHLNPYALSISRDILTSNRSYYFGK